MSLTNYSSRHFCHSSSSMFGLILRQPSSEQTRLGSSTAATPLLPWNQHAHGLKTGRRPQNCQSCLSATKSLFDESADTNFHLARSTPAGRPIQPISPTLAATIGSATIGSSTMNARVHEEHSRADRRGVVHGQAAGNREDVLVGVGSQFDDAQPKPGLGRAELVI